jgi:hypothetical protein
VQVAECPLLLVRDPSRGDDQEVAVAVEVAGSERERAGQVGADDVDSENRLDAGDQLCQQLVQLREARRVRQ